MSNFISQQAAQARIAEQIRATEQRALIREVRRARRAHRKTRSEETTRATRAPWFRLAVQHAAHV